MNIYVGNLPYKIRDEQLRDAFEEFGKVLSAEVIIDRRSKRSRGYGFVEMDTESDAFDAIEALHQSDFYGRELRVQPANSDEKSKPNNKRSKSRNIGRRGSKNKTDNAGGLLSFIKRIFGK